MKTIKHYLALSIAMTMVAGQIQAQEECSPAPAPVDCCDAYCDSGQASYLAAALPIGALIVAAIVIATTDNHHHHSSSSSSSSSHFH